MAAVAKEQDRELRTATEAPPEMASDGLTRRWKLESGEFRDFSLVPYPDGMSEAGYDPAADQRPVFWNPIYPGQEMWWRNYEKNDHGYHTVVQKEIWWNGQFRPRNDWEVFMTIEYLKTLPSGNTPVSSWKNGKHPWQGQDHPDNDPVTGINPDTGVQSAWLCQCGLRCPNWAAWRAHRRFFKDHQEVMAE